MLVGHFPRQLEWQTFAPMHNHTENGCKWPPQWSTVHIMSKELLPIILSCVVKGPLLARHKVPFQCDNSGVVAALQNDSARDNTIMHLLRCLWFFVAHYQGHSRQSGWPGFGRTTISQDKNKIPFYRKQVINKSARVILDLFSLLYYDMLYRKSIYRIAGKFRGRIFSRLTSLKTFHELNFEGRLDYHCICIL